MPNPQVPKYTAAMAASYKALRGRIHAINNTSAPAPGQGPGFYTRYYRAPLPLVIGSASFAADDWAGLAAPIARHMEEETWVSDEEDDLPLVRHRHTFSKDVLLCLYVVTMLRH